MAQHTPLVGLDIFDDNAAVIHTGSLSSPVLVHLPRFSEASLTATEQRHVKHHARCFRFDPALQEYTQDGCTLESIAPHKVECACTHLSRFVVLSNSTAEMCGDGIIQGGEECDDENAASNDGCSSSCRVENIYNCSGEPSVCAMLTGCGNLFNDTGADPIEECDNDAAAADGDGCSSQCKVEMFWECPGFVNCSRSSYPGPDEPQC